MDGGGSPPTGDPERAREVRRAAGDVAAQGEALRRGFTRLVGRSAELAWFDAHLQEALAGRPGLVLLSGEAGAGKTRLLREVESRARAAHLHVCVGRGYEDLPFPYLPFVEILRDQLADVPEAVNRVLGEDAERLRALVRGQSGRTGGAGELGGLPAERAALLMRTSRATIELARIRPTLIVLDDLHWADQTSVEQLLHLVFAVGDAATQEAVPLLVVTAYRPPGADELLERTLSRLRREPGCATLELPELDEDEVSQLVAVLTGLLPTRQLVRQLHGVTRGNALFVQEAVAQLLRRGVVREREGYAVLAAEVDAVALPIDLMGVLESRAREVSRDCRRVLIAAACLGDRFAPGDLAPLVRLGDEELLDRLEEAMEAQLLTSERGGFAFRHPLVRHVFYAMPSAARRQRIHRDVAAARVAHHGDRAADHALEIAHHLIRAGELTHPGELLGHAERAGEQAFERGAWDDAARFFSAAARAAEALADPPRRRLASLHFRAGVAHYRNMDVAPSLDAFDRAAALYEALDDSGGLAEVWVERTRARLTPGHAAFDASRDVEPLEALLPRLADDPARRGLVCFILAEATWTSGRPAQGEAYAREAVEIGRQLGDDRLQAQALTSLAMCATQQVRLREALTHLEEAASVARRTGDPWVLGHPLSRLPLVLAWLGRLAEAERAAGEACQLTRRLQDWAEHSLALATRTLAAVARGDVAEGQRHAEEALVMARRAHYPWGAALAFVSLASARASRGEWLAAEQALALGLDAKGVFENAGPALAFMAQTFRQLVQAQRGDAALRDAPLAVRLLVEAPGANPDLHSLGAVCAGLETAVRLGDIPLVARCESLLEPAAEQGVVFPGGWLFLLPRVLGVAAAARGDRARAEACFEDALALASETGSRSELARTCLDFARLRRDGAGEDDRAQAAALVQRAAALFDELGLAPFADEAQRLAGELGVRLRRPQAAPDAPAPAQAPAPPDDARTQVLLVTDMEGFTTLLDRLGDRRARPVLAHHDAILRACVREYRGREVQHTGDGLITAFGSVSSALGCAVAVQRDLARYNARHPDTPIRVRIGIHAGRALVVEDRLVGAAVNATVRIAAFASAGQILVSDAVREEARAGGARLRDRGVALLKGFSEPFVLHEALWAEP